MKIRPLLVFLLSFMMTHVPNVVLAEGMISTSNVVAEHPQAAVAWHNLAIVQSASRKKAEARKSAQKALELASPVEKIKFTETLRNVN